jgi:hypothetical protein
MEAQRQQAGRRESIAILARGGKSTLQDRFPGNCATGLEFNYLNL